LICRESSTVVERQQEAGKAKVKSKKAKVWNPEVVGMAVLILGVGGHEKSLSYWFRHRRIFDIDPIRV